MRVLPRKTRTRSIVFVLLLVALAGLPGSAVAQFERFKTASVRVPEQTNAGVWDGTYWYVNRDIRVAMWMRTTEGLPEIRLRMFSLTGEEDFTTDWNGDAVYEVRDGSGEFSLRLTERDANNIKGEWKWDLHVRKSVRKQVGEVKIYRSGTGREVVLLFEPFRFWIGKAGEERWQSVQQVWTFRKASARLIRWEELPF